MSRSRIALPLVLLAVACEPQSTTPDQTRMDVGGDVLAAGRAPSIADSISGDAMLAGGEVRFTGRTAGDVLAAGGDLSIGGTVGNSLRAAGGNIDIAGRITRNVTAAGGSISFSSGSLVEGNVYAGGGSMRLDGDVRGNVLAGTGSMRITGTVGGDVRLDGGSLTIEPGARIEGDLHYRVPPENVSIDPAATITGQRFALPPREGPELPTAGFFRAVWLLGFLLAGLAAVLLLPAVAEAAAIALHQQPIFAIGYGFLWLVALPVAAAIIAITIVGIPLAFILFALYLIGLYIARAAVAVWLGRLIVRKQNGSVRKRAALTFLVGGIILAVLELVPILGPIVVFASALLGIGAVIRIATTPAPA